MSDNFIANREGCFQFVPKNKKKVWGNEELVFNDRHCVKIMTLKPNYKCSLHTHVDKQESFVLILGAMVIETIAADGGKRTIVLEEQNDTITIEPNVPHRFYIPDYQAGNTIFIECSTNDSSDDSYRIEPSGKIKEA